MFQTGPATIESLRRLRALGVAVALDDFGIGYSSLTSLEQLPITRVKLDRLLVAGVDTNPRSAAIVRSIVALCHGLGLQVVAEGVERAAQLEFLAGCGPIGVQGYLLAHPVEAASAASEAQAASARARLSLEAAASGRGARAPNRWCSSAVTRRRTALGSRPRAPPQEGIPRRHPNVGLVGEEAVDPGAQVGAGSRPCRSPRPDGAVPWRNSRGRNWFSARKVHGCTAVRAHARRRRGAWRSPRVASARRGMTSAFAGPIACA